MADRKADRKRKGQAVFSSSQVPRFKTLYHEANFNSTLSARRVLPELIIQVDKSILDPCGFQIQQRKWEKFTKPLATLWSKNSMPMLVNQTKQRGSHTLRLQWKATKDFRLDHVLKDLCIIGADWVCHKDGRPHYLRRSDLEPMTKDDTLIPQEPPIVGVAMTRTREARARNPRQARQATPPQQEPPQEQPQPQFHHQQDFPSNFYTHFDASMSQIYRRLDQQQEENRKSFEAINTRMDRMDDQLSFLCYSNQMANEQMLFPYQNISRQFKEMEMQGIPVTMANLAIHRQREEEMNQERMRYDQILQEAAAQQAREANKGKSREVVPDSEEEFVSSESEEW
ncbi:hypothetical protein PIB30_058691 [Stylosanthes scabra]|uniref:Uncharacterized protein n=1 Tax=Stylosanthes scabra TaxID=79078 RepID=A0ABU6WNB8_9FABA|nr:hypothetical protein [Stylosanthes scabra]